MLVVALSCAESDVRRFDLTGQIVAIEPARSEVTIAHDAIPGYMAAMTMSFKVRGEQLPADLTPGDLVSARLVVTPQDGFLDRITRTGRRELPAVATPPTSTNYILEGDRLPEVALVDQSGEGRSLRDFAGVVTVVTFTYTRCPFPTFCPLIDRNFAALQRLILADVQLAHQVRLLSITIDPDHDTPAVLQQHAQRVKADPRVWRFAVPREAPDTLAERFGVTVKRDDRNPALVVHSLATVVVDPSALVFRIHRGNDWSPEAVLNDVKRALPVKGEQR